VWAQRRPQSVSILHPWLSSSTGQFFLLLVLLRPSLWFGFGLPAQAEALPKEHVFFLRAAESSWSSPIRRQIAPRTCFFVDFGSPVHISSSELILFLRSIHSRGLRLFLPSPVSYRRFCSLLMFAPGGFHLRLHQSERGFLREDFPSRIRGHGLGFGSTPRDRFSRAGLRLPRGFAVPLLESAPSAF
jgi:hypothetical protein